MNELIINGALAPDAAKMLTYFQAKVKAIKEEEDALKAALKEEMEKRGITALDTEELQIRYIAQGDTEYFDKTKFRRENPDLYDEYVSMRPRAAYVSIKVREVGE